MTTSSPTVSFVPESLVRYRLHGNNGHNNVLKVEHGMLLTAL